MRRGQYTSKCSGCTDAVVLQCQSEQLHASASRWIGACDFCPFHEQNENKTMHRCDNYTDCLPSNDWWCHQPNSANSTQLRSAQPQLKPNLYFYLRLCMCLTIFHFLKFYPTLLVIIHSFSKLTFVLVSFWSFSSLVLGFASARFLINTILINCVMQICWRTSCAWVNISCFSWVITAFPWNYDSYRVILYVQNTPYT